jgi:hypothetical protein
VPAGHSVPEWSPWSILREAVLIGRGGARVDEDRGHGDAVYEGRDAEIEVAQAGSAPLI